jgi:hypothetical protein
LGAVARGLLKSEPSEGVITTKPTDSGLGSLEVEGADRLQPVICSFPDELEQVAFGKDGPIKTVSEHPPGINFFGPIVGRADKVTARLQKAAND